MLSSYGLQKIVPDHIRGRIFAFDGMLVTLTFGASSLLTGWLAEARRRAADRGHDGRRRRGLGRRLDVAHDRRPARHDVGRLRRTAPEAYDVPGSPALAD